MHRHVEDERTGCMADYRSNRLEIITTSIYSTHLSIYYLPWKKQLLMVENQIFITVRNEVAKVMILHLFVYLSTRGSVSVHAGDTPLDQAPRTRHPLGPGPLRSRPPPQQTVTAADGTHPTGMHSCFLRNFENNG